MPRPVIVSHLPGRLRLRDPGLRLPPRNEGLRVECGAWDGVIAVEGNPKAGSLLLHYDVTRIQPEDMEVRVAQRLAVLLGHDSAIGSAAAFGEALWSLNRPAKMGMLASLAASLLALSVGKKAHAVFGALHLAFLTVHLANHRKKLLK